MYQYLYVPRSTGVYPYVPVCMCTAGVWSSWTLELPVGPRVGLPWFKQIYIFKCCFLAHVTARAQKKFGFVLVELLLRSASMRWALGDNNIIHCWDQWWEKCRVSWKKLQQKKRKSQRGDEEDKNSKGQTKSTHTPESEDRRHRGKIIAGFRPASREAQILWKLTQQWRCWLQTSDWPPSPPRPSAEPASYWLPPPVPLRPVTETDIFILTGDSELK